MPKTVLAVASEETIVQLMGGRMHVRWDETAKATPHGQLVFFAEFLVTAVVFDRWVEEARCATQARTRAERVTCWAR